VRKRVVVGGSNGKSKEELDTRSQPERKVPSQRRPRPQVWVYRRMPVRFSRKVQRLLPRLKDRLRLRRPSRRWGKADGYGNG